MHAYGRTLRQSGDLRLLALPVGSGGERYCVLDGPTLLATFSTLEGAEACFQDACAAGAGGPRPAGGTDPGGGAGAVTDLTAYRRRRARRPAGAGGGCPE
jgi:hypothetical protein